MKGAEVRSLRQKLGLTQVQLAGMVGVTANSVARWERDEMKIRESAARLMQMLDTQRGRTSTRNSSRSRRRGR